jgi:hypothetical protein
MDKDTLWLNTLLREILSIHMVKRHQETSKQAVKVGILFLLIWKGMKLFQIFTKITVSNRVEENGDHGHGIAEST